MEAIDYLKTARRMCHSYIRNRCDGCPFWKRKKCLGLPGDITEEEMVKTVQKWGRSNPLLEKCPYCGGEAFLIEDDGFYTVGCGDDECFGFKYEMPLRWESSEEAIDSWNRRA